MKTNLNKAVLNDLFSKKPQTEKESLIFLAEDEAMAEKIMFAGFHAVSFIDQKEVDEFLRAAAENCLQYSKQYYYVSCVQGGKVKNVQRALSDNGFTTLTDGCKIFQQNKSRLMVNESELADALHRYASHVFGVEKSIYRAEVIQADELMNLDIPPICWTVENLIAPGLSLVVGASKLGKSWWVLQMCLSVAAGKSFLDRRTTKQKVLYLALEDSNRRLKDRMRRVLQFDLAPEGLYFMTKAFCLGEGLIEQIEPYVKDGVKVIVIDTLQKIRKGTNNKNVYAADYDDMSQLKWFADENNVAVILVHHTNKKETGDIYDRVSGSNGIMGAADTTIILTKKKREESRAIMNITGRDVISEELALDFNKQACRWTCLGSAEDIADQEKRAAYSYDSVAKTVREMIEEYGSWEGNAANFQTEMMQRNNGYLDTREIGKRLRDIKKYLYEVDHIVYEEPTSTAKRIHKFKRENMKIS